MAQLSISKEYIPKELQGKIIVTKAYAGTVGLIPREFSSEYGRSVENGSLFQSVIIFEKDLYDCMAKSSNTMEVTPELNDFIENNKRNQVLIGFSDKWISLVSFLKLRVALPNRKREKLFPRISLHTWNPEQFRLFFNGALFLACAEIEEAPVSTDLGQIAREFIVECLEESSISKPNILGPTPIHPTIYFFLVKELKPEEVMQPSDPFVFEVDGDLVVITQEDVPLDDVLDYFLQDSQFALNKFYKVMANVKEHFDLSFSLRELVQELHEKLAIYFQLNFVKSFFRKDAGEIRQTLNRIYLLLLDISSLELEVRDQVNLTLKYLSGTTFLIFLTKYFEDQMQLSNMTDTRALSAVMSFAVEETSNFITVRTAIISAIIGAILGGILASIPLFLAK